MGSNLKNMTPVRRTCHPASFMLNWIAPSPSTNTKTHNLVNRPISRTIVIDEFYHKIDDVEQKIDDVEQKIVFLPSFRSIKQTRRLFDNS